MRSPAAEHWLKFAMRPGIATSASPAAICMWRCTTRRKWGICSGWRSRRHSGRSRFPDCCQTRPGLLDLASINRRTFVASNGSAIANRKARRTLCRIPSSIIRSSILPTSPQQHWELDDQGQPTQQVIETRRRADFITPIPKPKKRKSKASSQQSIREYIDEGISGDETRRRTNSSE